MNKYHQLLTDLETFPGGVTWFRIQKIAGIIKRLSPKQIKRLHIEKCSDEHTGQRYGQSQIRKGQCEKIGSGGRNKGQKNAYQIWAVWS